MPQFMREWLNSLDLDQLNEIYSWSMGDTLHEDVWDICVDKGYKYSEQQERWLQ